MNILPRILYILQTIPIKLPASFFVTCKRMCRNFIWASKSPRLSWDRMTLPKLKGGLGLPDIHKYHAACHLTRIIDWHVHKLTKDWITIEESFAQVPLSHLPWIDAKTIPKERLTHPLTGPMLYTFGTTSHTLKWNPSPGPMTPINDNPAFPPGLSPSNPNHDSALPTPSSFKMMPSYHLMLCRPAFQNITSPSTNFYKSDTF